MIFVEPVSISFNPGVKILSAEIIETNPANLKPNLKLSENKIIHEPLLLNEKDSLTIKALLTGFKDNAKILPNARIAGVREIKVLESKKNYRNWIPMTRFFLFLSLLFIIILTGRAFFSPLQISSRTERCDCIYRRGNRSYCLCEAGNVDSIIGPDDRIKFH